MSLWENSQKPFAEPTFIEHGKIVPMAHMFDVFETRNRLGLEEGVGKGVTAYLKDNLHLLTAHVSVWRDGSVPYAELGRVPHPSVYLLFGDEGKLLYVGQTENLKSRLRTHKKWIPFERVSFLCFDPAVSSWKWDLNVWESFLIHSFRPRLNSRYKSGAMVAPLDSEEVLDHVIDFISDEARNIVRMSLEEAFSLCPLDEWSAADEEEGGDDS